MLQFERGKKKKKSELSLKKKNLEEQRVDTQKMEKKNVKISLSLSLSLSLSNTHTHTHTQHTCSHFFVQEKGKNINSFRDIEKQQGQRQKKNLGICTLDNLPDKLFCLVLEERKKAGTFLGWDFIACTKQNFFCNNSFIQPTKKTTKKQGFEEEKILLSGFKTRDKHQSLFHLSEIVGPCAKTTIGEVVLLEILIFFLATDYCSRGGGGRTRVVPKSATRPKIRPPHNHPLHQPR